MGGNNLGVEQSCSWATPFVPAAWMPPSNTLHHQAGEQQEAEELYAVAPVAALLPEVRD